LSISTTWHLLSTFRIVGCRLLTQGTPATTPWPAHCVQLSHLDTWSLAQLTEFGRFCSICGDVIANPQRKTCINTPHACKTCPPARICPHSCGCQARYAFKPDAAAPKLNVRGGYGVLAFEKGDVFSSVEPIARPDGYAAVRNARRQVGLVPQRFVQAVDDSRSRQVV
jgi:hypothetical protein